MNATGLQHLLCLGVVSLGVACSAAPPPPPAAAPPKPTSERQRIGNISRFDLAVCYPAPPAASAPLNTEVLTGLLGAARPLVMECLVDPRDRGAAGITRMTIKSTAAAGTIQHEVRGENVTPEGQKCAGAAIDRFLAGVPGWAEKLAAVSAPVTAELEMRHIVDVTPTVTLGVNDASDVAGAVRLAEASWCDCYDAWKDTPPRVLTAKIKVVQGAAPQATFEPSNDEAAQGVAACLQKKVGELRVQTKSQEVNIPYTFFFVHSGIAASLADAPPDIAFQQLEAIRNRRAAEALVALGARTGLAQAYDRLVKKYQADNTSVPIDDLRKSCADLMAADDAWGASLAQQQEIGKQSLALVQQLKATDPEWGNAETASQNAVGTTEQDIAAAKQMRDSDEKACPKVH